MKQALKSIYLWLDSEATTVDSTISHKKRIDWLRCIPFILTHVFCLGVFFVECNVWTLAICLIGYGVRVFALTGFYHRFFSHRSFKTSRFMQFCFAILGASAAQRGPLLWSAHHRHHHKYSDDVNDKHSPHNDGFWWSHCG